LFAIAWRKLLASQPPAARPSMNASLLEFIETP